MSGTSTKRPIEDSPGSAKKRICTDEDRPSSSNDNTNASQRCKHSSTECDQQDVPKEDDGRDETQPQVIDVASPRENAVLDLTDQEENRSIYDFDDLDDEDIPCTHSRSQSPEVVISDAEPVRSKANKNKTNTPVPSDAEVIAINDDDITREYFVISDDDDDGDDKNADDDKDADANTQKSVSVQLADNTRINNSNLNTAHCAVCFDSPEETIVLPCGHIYCLDCVFKALSSMKTSTKHGGPCSLCRATTSYKRLIVGIFKKKKKSLQGR